MRIYKRIVYIKRVVIEDNCRLHRKYSICLLEVVAMLGYSQQGVSF